MMCARNKTWVSLLVAAMLALSLSFPSAVAAEPAPFETESAAVALMEANTGTFLICQNENARLPMASTTKIMTALVVVENAELSDMVTVDESAENVEGSSMYISAGERISVEDLLYGLMLASGNDAAVALAVHVGGDVDSFVAMMNDKADALGLENTHFVTPNGLHDSDHYTTARELALLASEAMKNEEIYKIASTKYHSTTTGEHVRTLKNKNALLWDYEGAFGIKTGYTSAAGRCLVFGANRNGMRLIGVLLNCRPMFEISSRLLDYASETYALCSVIEQGECAASIYVANGEDSILAVVAEKGIMVVLPRGEERSFTTEIILPDEIAAPIFEGQHIGTVNIYHDGTLVASDNLVAQHGVPVRGFLYWWQILIQTLAG